MEAHRSLHSCDIWIRSLLQRLILLESAILRKSVYSMTPLLAQCLKPNQSALDPSLFTGIGAGLDHMAHVRNLAQWLWETLPLRELMTQKSLADRQGPGDCPVLCICQWSSLFRVFIWFFFPLQPKLVLLVCQSYSFCSILPHADHLCPTIISLLP